MFRRASSILVLAAAAVLVGVPFTKAANPATPTFRVTSSADRTTVRVVGPAAEIVATATLGGAFRRPVVVRGVADGVSHDGKTLVLAGQSGSTGTVFAVLNGRSRWKPKLVELPSAFAYDALSANGRMLYLTQPLSQPAGHYKVRVYDLATNRLRQAAVTEKGREAEPMAGAAVARVTSADGEWVYTVYQGGHHGPFVHALYTERAVAFCLDLRPKAPEHRKTDASWKLKLAEDGSILRAVNEATGEARTVGLAGEWPVLLVN
jgi:hypothetical protein